MKRKRNGLRIMLREKPLGKESKLKTQSQWFSTTRRIWSMLKSRDWRTESPKRLLSRWWQSLVTGWVILQVRTMRKMGMMRMMKRQSRASWAKMKNQAGWCAATNMVEQLMERFRQKKMKLDKLTQPGWEEKADHFGESDIWYDTPELRVAAVVLPHTDDDTAPPAQKTLGELMAVWSTVPSVWHHPGLGRDGNSPSIPGTLPTFGSPTGTDGKDGQGRSGVVHCSPRRSSTDIHGSYSMYAIYTWK